MALGVRAARTWVMEASWSPPLARTITLSLPASSLYARNVVVSNQMKLNLKSNPPLVKMTLTKKLQCLFLFVSKVG